MSNFKVKQGNQEIVAPDLEALRQWVREGRVKLTDYVYNPTLDRWMYIRELAEVEDIVSKKVSNEQANQYNRMSFTFAGLGLLVLFIFPIGGVVLLAIGVVLSAMYYASKK